MSTERDDLWNLITSRCISFTACRLLLGRCLSFPSWNAIQHGWNRCSVVRYAIHGAFIDETDPLRSKGGFQTGLEIGHHHHRRERYLFVRMCHGTSGRSTAEASVANDPDASLSERQHAQDVCECGLCAVSGDGCIIKIEARNLSHSASWWMFLLGRESIQPDW